MVVSGTGTLDLLLPGELLQDQDLDHDLGQGLDPDRGQGQGPEVVEDQDPEVEEGGRMSITLGIRFMSLAYLQGSLKETLKNTFPRRARYLLVSLWLNLELGFPVVLHL